ncbi:MAG: gephyrin-like molybdotransferase Glp [Sphingomicrobium sp.]
MATGQPLITLDEARALLLADVAPVAAERVPIADGGGRTLAADVVAGRDQPPDPVSAMDGFAVRASDAVAGATLKVIGNAPAGRPFAGSVTAGTTVRIATGGVVPDGAERIVVQEIVERDGDSIRLIEAPGAPTYVRPRGCDFSNGETIARSGDLLTPARIGLAAAANLATIEVRARPRVLILASGDELREPGSELGPGLIVNSAAYALAGLVEAWGGIAVRAPILSDDHDRCRAQIEEAGLDADIVVPLGGASVGDRDVLRPVIEGLGARLLFDRIAVQPGKPCWHARFDGAALVLGLPGNPASAFVCAHLLLQPLLIALLGRSNDTLVHAILTTPMPKGGSREVYWRAAHDPDGEGRLMVTPDPRLDSSFQVPLAAANALIRRMPGAGPAKAGDLVEIVRLTL